MFINGVTGPNILAFSVIFVVILPASLSIYEDRQSGNINNILTRMNYKRYYIYKMLSIGLISGLILSISLTVFLFIAINVGKSPTNLVNNFTTGAFSYLYPHNKLIYSIIFILNSFIFGFVFSILGAVSTLFWNNKYAPSIITFALYIFSEPLLEPFNLNRFGFVNLFNYSDNFLTTPISIYGEFSITLMILLLTGYYQFKRLVNE